MIRRKCSNDEMPPGLLAKIEMCFNEDFDGDGIIGPPDAPTDAAERLGHERIAPHGDHESRDHRGAWLR